MAEAERDQNHVTSMLFVGTNGVTAPAKGDQTTGRLYVDLAGGSGTVTSFTFTDGNGFDGTVTDSTTTPTLSLTTTVADTRVMFSNSGAITGAASLTFNSGTGTLTATAFVGNLTGNVTGNVTGTASIATTVTVADEATDTTCFVNFTTAATGNLGVKTNVNMTFNSNTGVVTFASSVLTTTDINGGTIDGTSIGASSASTIIGTTIQANTGFIPDTDGGAYLGQPTQAFSNLYLDTGATINLDNSNWVATHSAGILTVGTGDLRVTNNFTNAASVVTIAGAQTLTNKTLTSPVIAVIGSNTLTLGTGTFTTLTFDAGATDPVITAASGLLTVTTGDLRVTSANVGTNADSVPTLSSTSTFTNKTLTSPTINTATLGGANLFAEGGSVQLDQTLSADGTWSGVTMIGTAGYTQAFGDLVHLDPTDSRWELADANSASGADGDSRGLLAMVVVTGTDGNPCTLLLQGNIRADAKFATFTVNNPIYVSETAGAITQTQPTTTDVVIRVIGAALTADAIYFNPDFAYITHT